MIIAMPTNKPRSSGYMPPRRCLDADRYIREQEATTARVFVERKKRPAYGFKERLLTELGKLKGDSE